MPGFDEVVALFFSLKGAKNMNPTLNLEESARSMLAFGVTIIKAVSGMATVYAKDYPEVAGEFRSAASALLKEANKMSEALEACLRGTAGTPPK